MRIKASKIQLLITCIILCFSMMSCSKTEVNDMVWSLTVGNGVATNDGYFMKDFTSPKMLFYDYNSKQTVPICSKPNCKHEQSSGCAAYINEGGFGAEKFIVYGDYIYYFISKSYTKMDIIRANTDNSNQIKIAEDEISSIYGIVAMDNKIYYSGSLHVYDESGDKIIGTILTVNCLDLEKNSVKIIKNQEKDMNMRIFFEGASKKDIFFLEIVTEDKKTDNTDASENVSAKFKKISLKTMEETVLRDAMDVVFDYYNTSGAYFVVKNSDTEFEVCQIDYDKAEIRSLFKTDSEIHFVYADDENVMYSKVNNDTIFNMRECYLYNKKNDEQQEIHFTDDGYQYFQLAAEYDNFLIGDMIYEDRQFRVQIKKDDFESGKLKYNFIWSNDSTALQDEND